MNRNEPLVELGHCGIDPDAQAGAWRDSTDLLAGLDGIGRSGGSAVVKIDGARGNSDIYTVVLSGGRLGDNSFRKDGSNLNTLLVDAISFFMKHAAR